MHGSAAEIRSPGAFGGVIEECEEACLFGRRDEVMIDCQAWYWSLLRAQNCFIIVAATSYTNRHIGGFVGLGNWYEEVIDGFPFFNGWLHGSGKGCKTNSRDSGMAVLVLRNGLHQALLSLLESLRML